MGQANDFLGHSREALEGYLEAALSNHRDARIRAKAVYDQLHAKTGDFEAIH